MSSRECEEFYRLRDARSQQCLGDPLERLRPVRVVVGEEPASTPAGQVLVLGLANQLARIHRSVTYSLAADVPLLVPSPLGNERSLGATLLSTMRAIDPCGRHALSNETSGSEVVVGVGVDSSSRSNFYVGAHGAIAEVGLQPVTSDWRAAGTLRGAALASCFAASAALRLALGEQIAPLRLSAWNYLDGNRADRGPADLVSADMGRVLVVGAGAVASAFAYWQQFLELRGEWTVVDRDTVKLHNTNRGMLFVPADAGWPSGEERFKADIVANALGGSPYREWYGECEATQAEHDLVLCLANERGVRTAVAVRSQPVVLHATTGGAWQAALHRHLAGRDDCIRCRTNDDGPGPQLQCSVGALPVASGETSTDAALPFVSAAAGVMLVTALERLASGHLREGEANIWRWLLRPVRYASLDGVLRCKEGCTTVLPARVRSRLYSRTRWSHYGQDPLECESRPE